MEKVFILLAVHLVFGAWDKAHQGLMYTKYVPCHQLCFQLTWGVFKDPENRGSHSYFIWPVLFHVGESDILLVEVMSFLREAGD